MSASPLPCHRKNTGELGAAFPASAQMAGCVRAISGRSSAACRALVSRFDWMPVGAVVDVGCSGGALLAHLLDARLQLHGVGFSVPGVRDRFTGYLEDSGVAGPPRPFLGRGRWTRPATASGW